MRRILMTAALGCGIALLAAHASTAQKSDESKTLTDNDFVAKAAVGGSTEVALAKLATERGESDEVKSFARQMITDHTKANQELLTLAGRKQIPVPKTVDSKHQKCLDEMARLQGSEFDRMYGKQMVKDHEETIGLFEAESKQGQDAELKGMAERLLPTLRDHLKMARKLPGAGQDGDKGDDKAASK